MRKYNIYGMGAALVDTEVSVRDEFLITKNIDKGVMTLVNEARQDELINNLRSLDSHFIRNCGGSVCNSIVAASRFGASTFFSGKVANDADGEFYESDLNEIGVDFHKSKKEPGVTGKCLVMVTEDAERTMNTFLGVSENLSAKEVDKNALKNSDWFYVEGYLVTNESRAEATKEAIKYARKNDTRIALSLSDPFVVEAFGESLRDVIGEGVDLIFCNKDEALAFTSTYDLNSAVKYLKQFAKTFVVTDGKNGSVIFDGKSVLKTEAFHAQAIDTNGAGDMFAGAFLYAIVLGKTYDFAAKLANFCAAKVVERFGPRLEAQEFVLIKERFFNESG